MSEAQIDPSHYEFERYIDIKRWSSYWHQARETLASRPASVLEIGIGNGIFRALLKSLHCPVRSIDINAALKPDFVGSVTALPFADASFGTVVAFQVLEHLPYELFGASVREMARVSSHSVLLSLPDARKVWRVSADVGYGEQRISMPRPRLRAREHKGSGDHKWEISKRGYPVERVVADIEAAGLSLVRTYRAPENPYHRFFICLRRPA